MREGGRERERERKREREGEKERESSHANAKLFLSSSRYGRIKTCQTDAAEGKENFFFHAY